MPPARRTYPIPLLFVLVLLGGRVEKAVRADENSPPPTETPSAGDDFTWVDTKRKPSEEKWTARPTRGLEHVKGFPPRETAGPLDRFGGRLDRRRTATGFFRTEKIDGRWWFVDPDGSLWYCVGCGGVAPNHTPGGEAAMNEKFGSSAGWAAASNRLLREHGFNNLGNWSDIERLQNAPEKLPYTRSVNFMSGFGKQLKITYQRPGHTGYPNDCIPVFHPDFPDYCRRLADEAIAPAREDPHLIGYFSDNEMPFPADALDRYLQLPADDAGHREARRWLEERTRGRDADAITDADRAAFLRYMVSTYYAIVGREIRRADPNHLYLGGRLHGGDLRREAVLGGCGPHVDVVSVNWYGCWTPDTETMDRWSAWTDGKPFFITEWYAKGMDSGMANLSGAGWTVKTQRDRGLFYQNFALGLLQHPDCVGWHWFKYQDNDPADTGADPSNTDSNKGIVDNRFEPYAPLLDRMRILNANVYGLIDHFDEGR